MPDKIKKLGFLLIKSEEGRVDSNARRINDWAARRRKQEREPAMSDPCRRERKRSITNKSCTPHPVRM